MLGKDQAAIEIWKSTPLYARKQFTFDQYAARKALQYSRTFTETGGKMCLTAFEKYFHVGMYVASTYFYPIKRFFNFVNAVSIV